MTDLVERLRLWADADIMETARDGTFEYNDGVKWAALMVEAADALEASQAQASAPIDPEMPAQQLRLHMGELTASELRVARAAIAWANTAAQAQAAEVRRETTAEAVAWRWRMPEDEFWTFSQREPNHDNWPTMIYERLYAHPAAIRALTDAAKEPDHFPDARNMIAKPAGDHFPDAGEMVEAAKGDRP